MPKKNINKTQTFKYGDIISPTSNTEQLRSGCSLYPHAIVISTEPLVLVSEDGDMRWSSTIENMDFKKIGEATVKVLKKCKHRNQQ